MGQRRLSRRLGVEPLERRELLSASPWCSAWHNFDLPADVDDNGEINPADALLVINELNGRGAGPLSDAGVAGEGEGPMKTYVDVNDDGALTPVDVLGVVNVLNQSLEAIAPPTAAAATSPLLSEDEVQRLLRRAAAASASEDAIIAIVDRGGRILGVRAEQDVLDTFGVGTPAERTRDFIFAVDGAVAKARTAAFFANDSAPLTSRTVRFISQSTVTQREVESNPNILDLNSPLRGPGFVAPIGLGGHFPPGVAHTPPVDLFAIEHTNRDSIMHPGKDSVRGTGDDQLLMSRFNINPAFVPDGKEIEPPESYGFASGRFPNAQSRGVATLPGGIPLLELDPATNKPSLVGGIGVFFPGRDGFATFEQSFVPRVGQLELDRLNAPKVLESEWIAFAAAGGSAQAGAPVGTLGGEPPVPGFILPFDTLTLVGIRLEVFGPHPTRHRPQPGAKTLLDVGARVGRGSPASGADQIVTSGDFYRAGKAVPDEWLVTPHDSPTGEISAAEVRRIIEQGIAEAERVRAAIRLPKGSRTRMVFAVADRQGEVLGLFRMTDATVFSIDVAVAKARNTAYYADPLAIQPEDRVDDNGDGIPDPNVPAGAAFTNRTFRFLAEPRYPAGVDGSKPPTFSILLDPGINVATAENLGPPLPASVYSNSQTSVLGFDAFNVGRNFRDPDNIYKQNGIVFFPGSAPLYESTALIGGVGVSGDGVDQDDVVTFSAVEGFRTPGPVRADMFFVRGVRLPYQKFLRNPRA